MIFIVLFIGLMVLALCAFDVLICLKLGYLSFSVDDLFERIAMLEHDTKIDRGDY